MPDHGVVHCRACKTYQVLTWHSSSQSDYFTCKRCSQKTRGHVVRDNDHNVLRSYDLRAMKAAARQMNERSARRCEDGRLSKQCARTMVRVEEATQRLKLAREARDAVREAAQARRAAATLLGSTAVAAAAEEERFSVTTYNVLAKSLGTNTIPCAPPLEKKRRGFSA